MKIGQAIFDMYMGLILPIRSEWFSLTKRVEKNSGHELKQLMALLDRALSRTIHHSGSDRDFVTVTFPDSSEIKVFYINKNGPVTLTNMNGKVRGHEVFAMEIERKSHCFACSVIAKGVSIDYFHHSSQDIVKFVAGKLLEVICGYYCSSEQLSRSNLFRTCDGLGR
ncbi:MAG: hypothetical protein AAB837_01055 [Patescibacteria group bacterium]